MPREFSEWKERWITPTTLMALLGGIVWGIQLNFLAVHNSNAITNLETRLADQIELHATQSEKCIRLATLVDEIRERLREDREWELIMRQRDLESKLLLKPAPPVPQLIPPALIPEPPGYWDLGVRFPDLRILNHTLEI
jgi:hypothetical protein